MRIANVKQTIRTFNQLPSFFCPQVCHLRKVSIENYLIQSWSLFICVSRPLGSSCITTKCAWSGLLFGQSAKIAVMFLTFIDQSTSFGRFLTILIYTSLGFALITVLYYFTCESLTMIHKLVVFEKNFKLHSLFPWIWSMATFFPPPPAASKPVVWRGTVFPAVFAERKNSAILFCIPALLRFGASSSFCPTFHFCFSLSELSHYLLRSLAYKSWLGVGSVTAEMK